MTENLNDPQIRKDRRFTCPRFCDSAFSHLIDDVHGIQAAGITDIGHALLHSAIQLGRVIAHAQVAGGMPAQLILAAALREDQTECDQLTLPSFKPLRV